MSCFKVRFLEGVAEATLLALRLIQRASVGELKEEGTQAPLTLIRPTASDHLTWAGPGLSRITVIIVSETTRACERAVGDERAHRFGLSRD